ncbi:MAG: kelch repeat-containing protein [Candidatus Limnocylindria bacterium]
MQVNPRYSLPTLLFALVLAACSPQPPAQPTASPQPTSAEPSASAPPAATVTPTPAPSPTPTPTPIAWSSISAPGPAAREDHTWTLDATGTTAYLFGGRDGASVYDDTWSFDLSSDSWSQLAPSTSPPGRFGHEASWVDGIGLVIFSGQGGPSTFFNDLWAYDPVADAWRELPASGALPTPRYGSCAAIGQDGRLWISHGFTQEGTRFSDTRAYDFASGQWSDETPSAGGRPVERCLHGCWWTEDGAFVLYAGQTTGLTSLDDLWSLDSGQWSRIEGSLPPARNLYARARSGNGTLVFGGQAIDGGYLADLWLLEDGELDGGELTPTGTLPPGRAGAELIVDPDGGRALLFGGRTADGTLDDLWVLDGI